jgi:uncharacterized protein
MAERIQAVEVPGPAGRLEGLLHHDEARTPDEIAVVCHPHPLFGGNMHNKVVHRLDRALFSSGRFVLRFNFRGVGASTGRYDEGYGENEDVRAAIAYLRDRFGEKPLVLAGFSFGAARALEVGWKDDRVSRLICVGAPDYAFDGLDDRKVTKPLLIVHGSEDEVAPIEPVRTFVTRLEGRFEFIVIEGADHFFPEHLDPLENAVRAWL